MAEKVQVGTRNLTVADVVAVALHGNPLVLDETALEKMREATKHAEVATPCAVPETTRDAAASGPPLSPALTRAVLLAVLAQVAHAKSGVRADVAQFLAGVLNGATALPCLHAGGVAADLLALLSSGPGLNPSERTAISALSGPAAGVAVVVLFGASSLLPVADAVAALSIDARGFGDAGKDTLLLDTEYNELGRNHPGQVASSTTLRLLLEGSRSGATLRGGVAGAAVEQPPVAFRTVPQRHGAAFGVVAAALRSALVELNSAMPSTVVTSGGGKAPGGRGPPVPLSTANTPAPLDASILLSALAAAEGGLDALAAASAARVVVEEGGGAAASAHAAPSGDGSARSTSGSSGSSALDASLSFGARVDALVLQLAAEVAGVEAGLADREASALLEAAAKEVKKAAAAAARAEVEAVKLAALSPEERAKTEAEAAKKREKQAKKDAAVAAATTSAPTAVVATAAAATPNVLGLGPGVAEWRGYIGSFSAAGKGEGVAAVPVDAACALRALSPYGQAAPLLFPGSTSAASSSSSSSSSPSLLLPRPDVFVRGLVDRIGSGGGKRRAKIVKGARDFMPEQVREKRGK